MALQIASVDHIDTHTVLDLIAQEEEHPKVHLPNSFISEDW